MNTSDSVTSTKDNAPLDESGIVINVFGRTDVGVVREHNEDNFLIADLSKGNKSIMPEVRTHVLGPRGSLFVVCDGMGGAAAGEVASKIGVDTVYEMMQECSPPEDDVAVAKNLDMAICEAGTRIFTAAKLNKGQRGMGTTATVASLVSSRLIVGQVGDSRAYILRNGKMVQISKDQSLVQQLLDAKQLTQEEAKNFDKSNIILQALGTTEDVHVDITSTVLKRNDILVMCSDGLCGLVEDDDIRDIVLAEEDQVEVCKQLTELACDNGGDDNITVIVTKFTGAGLEPPTEEDLVFYEKFQYKVLDTPTVMPGADETVNQKDGDSDNNPSSLGKQLLGEDLQELNERETEPEVDESDEVSEVVSEKSMGRSFLLAGVFVIVIVIVVVGVFYKLSSSTKEVADPSNGSTIHNAMPIAVPNQPVPSSVTPHNTVMPPISNVPNALERNVAQPPIVPAAVAGEKDSSVAQEGDVGEEAAFDGNVEKAVNTEKPIEAAGDEAVVESASNAEKKLSAGEVPQNTQPENPEMLSAGSQPEAMVEPVLSPTDESELLGRKPKKSKKKSSIKESGDDSNNSSESIKQESESKSEQKKTVKKKTSASDSKKVEPKKSNNIDANPYL